MDEKQLGSRPRGFTTLNNGHLWLPLTALRDQLGLKLELKYVADLVVDHIEAPPENGLRPKRTGR